MIFLSLALNIVVLVPVCWGVATGASWANAAYGNASAARGILLAIYLAILFASVVLLLRPLPAAVATLLAAKGCQQQLVRTARARAEGEDQKNPLTPTK